MIKRICLLLCLFLAFFAGKCESERPPRKWEVGDFHPIPGKKYNLPKGLEVDSIIGEEEEEIPTSDRPLAFYVRNTTQKEISVTMPEGLVFSPENTEYAYMLLVQKFSFNVPGGQSTKVLLPTYSGNEEKDDPDRDAKYKIDIQVWEKELGELFDLLAKKKLDGEAVLVQDAVWEITDDPGYLTDSTREAIKNLPE